LYCFISSRLDSPIDPKDDGNTIVLKRLEQLKQRLLHIHEDLNNLLPHFSGFK
jgi:hypothetical protein